MYKCWYGKTCDRAKENCYLSCVRYKLMHSLFNLSNLPEYLWIPKNLTCSNIDSESFHQLKNIYNDIYDYVQKGKNLYIFSNNCGNGKTSWTIKLMFSYFDKIWHKSCFDKKALFINVPSFLYDYKRSISQKVDGLEELCNDVEKVDLVIWMTLEKAMQLVLNIKFYCSILIEEFQQVKVISIHPIKIKNN